MPTGINKTARGQITEHIAQSIVTHGFGSIDEYKTVLVKFNKDHGTRFIQLLEDMAEFGYGLGIGEKNRKEHLK